MKVQPIITFLKKKKNNWKLGKAFITPFSSPHKNFMLKNWFEDGLLIDYFSCPVRGIMPRKGQLCQSINKQDKIVFILKLFENSNEYKIIIQPVIFWFKIVTHLDNIGNSNIIYIFS